MRLMTVLVGVIKIENDNIAYFKKRKGIIATFLSTMSKVTSYFILCNEMRTELDYEHRISKLHRLIQSPTKTMYSMYPLYNYRCIPWSTIRRGIIERFTHFYKQSMSDL